MGGSGWIVLVLVALCLAERRRPLRRRVDPKPLRRAARNATIGLTSLGAGAALEWAVVRSGGAWAARHHVGLLRSLRLPVCITPILGFLALDYSNYLWHVANHRAPALWRFHLVHHVDRELDASTGLRFHFGEITLTAALRLAQILIIGADRATLSLWQRVLTLSVIVHHSNLRLPAGVDRMLSLLVVTPRMHGVHHSENQQETDSNFASVLSVWDLLHGTRRMRIRQQDITIGIPGIRDPRDLTIGPLLTMPFRAQRRAWPQLTSPSSSAGSSPPTPQADPRPELADGGAP